MTRKQIKKKLANVSLAFLLTTFITGAAGCKTIINGDAHDKDEYSKYTLTALAELCGFSSRTSFFRYFKKVIGITPNEYIRSIGKTNEE